MRKYTKIKKGKKSRKISKSTNMRKYTKIRKSRKSRKSKKSRKIKKGGVRVDFLKRIFGDSRKNLREPADKIREQMGTELKGTNAAAERAAEKKRREAEEKVRREAEARARRATEERAEASAVLFSHPTVNFDYKPSSKCIKLQKELDDYDKNIKNNYLLQAKYNDQLAKYYRELEKWYGSDDYKELEKGMYYSSLSDDERAYLQGLEPRIPTEPKLKNFKKPSKEFIESVAKECGKHFIQNI